MFSYFLNDDKNEYRPSSLDFCPKQDIFTFIIPYYGTDLEKPLQSLNKSVELTKFSPCYLRASLKYIFLQNPVLQCMYIVQFSSNQRYIFLVVRNPKSYSYFRRLQLNLV
jgi:hypothetical protein